MSGPQLFSPQQQVPRSLWSLLCMTTLLLSSIQLATATTDSNDNNNKKDLSAGKLRQLAENALMERKFTDAESYYKQAIALEPTNSANHYKLFNLHKRMRNYSDALGDITTACQLLEQADSDSSDGKSKNKTIEYKRIKAKLLVNLGRCDEAVQEYKSLKEVNDDASTCATITTAALELYQQSDWSLNQFA